MPELVPLIPVMLDRERHLLFQRRAVKTVELELTRLWGRNTTFYQAMRSLVECILDDDWAKLSFVNLAMLLWQGCVHEDSSLTLEQVEDAMPCRQPQDLLPYVTAVLQAWQAGTPTPAGEAAPSEATPDPLAVSTGAPSGVSSVYASV